MSDVSAHRMEMPGVDPRPAINPSARRSPRPRPSLDEVWVRLCQGDRAALSLAITWLESTLPRDHEEVTELLDRAQRSGNTSTRIGFTGVPGVGKSTLIEAVGLELLGEDDVQLAVLAVDPSSPISGGSILGDKSRMVELSRHPRAFIRPSPSRGTLGGVGAFTCEAISLCEAAGMNVIVVETVGVGQSESTVRDLVDVFLLLMLTGAGDDLQGMKRGVLELADLIAVTKADGDNRVAAEVVAQQLRAALGYFTPASAAWSPLVQTVSVREANSVRDLVEAVARCHEALAKSGDLVRRRREQTAKLTNALMDDYCRRSFDNRDAREMLVSKAAEGELSPRRAAAVWWESAHRS